MEQHLQFKIGSNFNGEGFDKLSAAAKSSAGTVSRVTGVAGELAEKIVGVDKSTSALVKTGGKLLSGFLSMGVWGAVIGAATALVGWITKIFEEEKKSAEELDRMNNAWKTAEGRAAAYAKHVKEWRDKAKEAAEAEKKAAADRVAAEKAELANAQAQQKAWDKIRETKEKIAALDDSSKSGAAQLDVNNAARRVNYEERFGTVESRAVAKAELELAEAKLEKALDDEAAEHEAAAKEEKEAREQQKQKIAEMREAMEEEIEQREIANQEQLLVNAEKDAAKATEAVAKAQAKLEKAIEAYNSNITQNLTNETIQGAVQTAVRSNGTLNTWGGLIANRGNITAAAADVKVEELLQSGQILTTDELRKARNQAVRDANDVINSKSVNQQIKDEERAARLSQMSEKAMSKADKDWLADYQKVKDAKDAQKRAVQAAKDEKAFAEIIARQQFDEVRNIRKKLDQLGLR